MVLGIRIALQIVLLIGVLATTSACFKNPGEESLPLTGMSVPLTPDYNYPQESYLIASGPCKGLTAFTVTYASEYTPSKTVDLTCKDDKVYAKLPVVQGNKQQTFSVSITARMRSRKAPVINTVVSFNPLPALNPGFAILSAGGIQTGPGLTSINASVGEVLDKGTQSAASLGNLRVGVQGVNDPYTY